MSLWSEYREERNEAKFIEKENGFASYSIHNDECYLQDIYVRPEFRKTGLAKELADEVCKKAIEGNCKRLIGSVVVGTRGDSLNLRLLLEHGMKLLSVNNNIIYVYRDF